MILLTGKSLLAPNVELIPAVMQSATTALIKGATTPTNVLVFYQNAKSGDEVGLQQIGAQYLAIPLFVRPHYYEEATMSTSQSFATATYVQPTGLTQTHKVSNISGTPWNLSAGTWIAPVAGIYTFTISVLFSLNVANTRLIVIGSHNSVSAPISDLFSTNCNYTLTYNKFCAKDDTFHALISQLSGATKSQHTGAYMSIRLAEPVG